MITRGEFAALLLLNRSKLKKPLPRPPPPTAQARRYNRALQAMLAEAWDLISKKLLPAGRDAADRASRIASTVRQDADPIGDAIDQIEEEFWKKWTRKRIAKMVEPIAGEVERFQAKGMNRQLSAAVGAVDVVGSEPWISDAVDEFTSENVALIKTIPQTLFDQVESVTKREIADGARWEQITPMIQERFNVSQSRAKLIARDQVGKFYGDLNRVRQKDLGITQFTWRTMNDNRVREEHEDLNGQVFDWNRPPDGETPGEPVNCRCYADPVLSPDQ